MSDTYANLQERHIMDAMVGMVEEYLNNNLTGEEEHISTSSYNPDWFYSIKYNKDTGLVVGVHGSEYDGLDFFPASNEPKYDTMYIGKLSEQEFEVFGSYSMEVQDTFIKLNEDGTYTVFKINIDCSGEYIEAMNAYYSPDGNFRVSVYVQNLSEQLRESFLEGFYVKDMSKGEITIQGMALEDNGYKTSVTKENPDFLAIVKNLDGDDSNQVLRVRVKFKGGDDIDMNPNTMTKYLMLLTNKPSEEELNLWKKKMIRRHL